MAKGKAAGLLGKQQSVQTDASEQVQAFTSLCDIETARLRVSLSSPQGVKAIATLNRVTTQSILLLSDVTRYEVGCTLCQGACLLVAVFWQLQLMGSAWCGPECGLGKQAVSLLSSFQGTAKTTVCYHYSLLAETPGSP